MTEDWFVTAIDGVVHAARDAGEALDAAIGCWRAVARRGWPARALLS